MDWTSCALCCGGMHLTVIELNSDMEYKYVDIQNKERHFINWLLEKLIVGQLFQKFPTFYGTRRFITDLTITTERTGFLMFIAQNLCTSIGLFFRMLYNRRFLGASATLLSASSARLVRPYTWGNSINSWRIFMKFDTGELYEILSSHLLFINISNVQQWFYARSYTVSACIISDLREKYF
jgi:hypothetical protein